MRTETVGKVIHNDNNRSVDKKGYIEQAKAKVARAFKDMITPDGTLQKPSHANVRITLGPLKGNAFIIASRDYTISMFNTPDDVIKTMVEDINEFWEHQEAALSANLPILPPEPEPLDKQLIEDIRTLKQGLYGQIATTNMLGREERLTNEFIERLDKILTHYRERKHQG